MFMVWVALVVLTAVTVGVTYADMETRGHPDGDADRDGQGEPGDALLHAHALREAALSPMMILVILVTYAIFVGLTFADYSSGETQHVLRCI